MAVEPHNFSMAGEEATVMGLPYCENISLTCQVSTDPTITWDAYRVYNVAVIGVTLPCFVCFGAVSNLVNVAVFSHRQMHSSLNTYLGALAVSDFFTVTTSIFIFTFETLRRFFASVRHVYLSVISWLFAFGLTAQTCSVYFTVLAGLDGFISVCAKRCAPSMCRVRVAFCRICVVVFLAIGYNVPHFFEVEMYPCRSFFDNSSTIVICPTALRADGTYNMVYYNYMYTIIMMAFPLALLIAMSAAIIAVGSLQERQRKAAGVTGQQEGDSPIALIMVILLFIFCNALGLIINFLETSIDEYVLSYLVDVSNLLVVFNSSVNFIIYMIFDAKFAKTFRALCCCKTQSAQVRFVVDPSEGQQMHANGPFSGSTEVTDLTPMVTPIMK